MIALVTGGTSGIGRAIANLLEEKKISVIRLGSQDGDLSLLAGREKVLELIKEHKPDLIVNSAGLGFYGDAISLSLEEQIKILDVNVRALLEITLVGARVLREQNKRGVIVNISSIAGEMPTPGMSVYGASKAFVTQFSKALDFELRKEGIRVLVSCPGMVETNFATRAAKKKQKLSAMKPEKVAEKVWRQIEERKAAVYFPHTYLFAKLLPSRWIQRLIYRSIQKRI